MLIKVMMCFSLWATHIIASGHMTMRWNALDLGLDTPVSSNGKAIDTIILQISPGDMPDASPEASLSLLSSTGSVVNTIQLRSTESEAASNSAKPTPEIDNSVALGLTSLRENLALTWPITASSLQQSNLINVMVDNVTDSSGDPTNCITNTDLNTSDIFSGNCNLRSAVEYCGTLDQSVTLECAIHLPTSADEVSTQVTINSIYGEISVSPTVDSVSLSLFGHGASIVGILGSRDSVRTRFFSVVADGSSLQSYSFNMYNTSLSGFEHESGNGGVIYATGEIFVNMDHVSISGGRGSNGGALFVSSRVELSLISCSFIDNLAFEDGGSVIIRDSNSVQIFDCQFNSNMGSFGAAIKLEDSSNVVFTYNRFVSNSAYRSDRTGRGGALYIQGGDNIELTGCYFEDNDANGGGAVVFMESEDISVVASVFQDHDIPGDAAALLIEDCRGVFVSKSEFLLNEASGRGGSLYLLSNLAVVLSENSFSSSEATNGGGAIYSDNNLGLSILGCNFLGHSTSLNGGALYLINDENVEIYNSTFARNTGIDGGAMYLEPSGAVSIMHCFFELNKAMSSVFIFISNAGSGGAIFMTASSEVALFNNIFTSNTASSSGGAIYSEQSLDTMSVEGSTFVGNRADEGGAVAVRLFYSLYIESTTFINNTGSTSGGSLHLNDHDSTVITNCTFMDNVATGKSMIC